MLLHAKGPRSVSQLPLSCFLQSHHHVRESSFLSPFSSTVVAPRRRARPRYRDLAPPTLRPAPPPGERPIFFASPRSRGSLPRAGVAGRPLRPELARPGPGRPSRPSLGRSSRSSRPSPGRPSRPSRPAPRAWPASEGGARGSRPWRARPWRSRPRAELAARARGVRVRGVRGRARSSRLAPVACASVAFASKACASVACASEAWRGSPAAPSPWRWAPPREVPLATAFDALESAARVAGGPGPPRASPASARRRRTRTSYASWSRLLYMLALELTDGCAAMAPRMRSWSWGEEELGGEEHVGWGHGWEHAQPRG